MVDINSKLRELLQDFLFYYLANRKIRLFLPKGKF